ncbi:ABC transporter ATP-binding protein [Pontiella sulfatireligans]|uniref:Putative ABC transporter ATP-binding protein n=1 Tax=Pontiella sulfatireligans TaxID=2750658 RepID=A0A6C2ULW7_9BACT|nr:ABC transporter ATP-binding protein [Pontiella sulfatireligans]VGO21260.1 putative ABC transporter ATP-binding protein [Pontiella sulfatireligans]
MNMAKRLLAYSLPYWRWLILAFAMITFTALSINFLPVLIQRITDQCLMNADAPADERIELLMRLSVIYISIAGIGHLVRYFQAMLTAWIGQKIIYDLRLEVFRKVLRMHQAYFDRTAVGTLMTRVTSDIERLQHFVTEGVVGSIADLFMLFGIMGYMIYISPWLSLAIFSTLPLLFAFMFYVNTKLRDANRDIRDRQSRLNAFLQESLTGMTTIQLFNREASAMEDFDERHTKLRSAYFDEVRWFSLYFPTVEGGQALAVLLILAVGGMMLLQGSEAITLGIFVAFLAYIRDFFRPLGSLSDKAGSFQIAMASIERVFALLDAEEEVQDPAQTEAPDRIAGTIAFNKVWFAYNNDNWVIKDLSFSVEPGQVLAVVGATGAGKSTIINLIGRFYDVQQGAVTIDGIDVRQFNKHDLRGRLGYVFQDPFIFTGSVADNIALQTPGISRAEVIHAAKTVNAHNFIEAMPEGYDTVLNERGEGLSLGQKQLLVMARALAQNPELLFVLDEATASVDTATEVLIQDALAKLMANRTSIVIAHRLSTIRHADRILVMRHGELVDQGTHNELMAHDGYYRQLYDLLQHSPEQK